MDQITYKGNPLIRRAGTQIQYTAEQVKEFKKCAKDPVYFIENYIKIQHVDKGLVQFKLYPYQKRLVKALHKNRFNIVKAPRQSGKCLLYQSLTSIRNKKTGEIIEIPIGEFFDMIDKKQESININE